MSLLQRIFPFLKAPAPVIPNENSRETESSEKGRRATPEDQVKYLYRMMWVDPDLRQSILDMREQDKLDGRVKRIHSRVARDVIKGGLVMQIAEGSEDLGKLWDEFQRRLQLNRVEKLKSDARGLVMEGNLPIQWVLDKEYNVVAGVRMPSETILPNVTQNGRFKDVTKAYVQFDVLTGAELASFPLWQLFVARFDPDNFDDMGSLGRPFLDASRTTWRKLAMTEEDLVIRRRTRAPFRMGHFLKGATQAELDAYEAKIKNGQGDITTDFFSNKEGSIQAIQGDANLDHNKDIVHLLDTLFAGSPLPKGMMGYTDGMARDILEDLKRDYYDEVDVLQDTLSFAYEQGFRLQLLLKGINPDDYDFTITFAERRTETPNQTADRGLKLQVLGIPQGMVWEELGYDASYVRKRKEWEAKHYDPYPDPDKISMPGGGKINRPPGGARVSITPGNGRKGESGTSISNK